MSKGNQYTPTPLWYKGTNKWMKVGNQRYMVGPARKPWFIQKIRTIMKTVGSCVIIVTGKPGRGKTYLSLRLAETLDKDFNIEEQVIYDQKQMLNAISDTSPLKRGQVIILDEAQFTVSSRNWYDQLQKDLMQNLQAVRSKGLIIIIVALGIDIIDNILRKHIITYRIHVNKRGTGKVLTYDSNLYTGEEMSWDVGTIKRTLPGSNQCTSQESCLLCEYSGLTTTRWNNREKWEQQGFHPCQVIRAKYERRKKEYVEIMNKRSVVKAETQMTKTNPATEKELEIFFTSIWNSAPSNRLGRKDIDYLMSKAKEHFIGKNVPRNASMSAQKNIERNIGNQLK